MSNPFDNFGEPESSKPNPEDRPQGNGPGPAGPRRRPRSEEFDSDGLPPPKEMSVLGLISLVTGISALCASFIPCVGVFAIVSGVFGLLLGIAGYISAKGSPRQGTGLPVVGIIVNLLAIVVGGLWLYFLVGLFKGITNDLDYGQPPVATLTATELNTEYNANELATDAKYLQKVLLVTGRIKKITRNTPPGPTTVELVGVGQKDREPSESPVHCDFTTFNAADLQSYAVGDEITIRGLCYGKVGGWVTLNKCTVPTVRVIKKESDPLTLTAQELDNAYEDNVLAADKKYKGKTLTLSGEVLRVSRDKPGKITLELDTATGTLDCDFTGKEHLAQLEMLQPEQKVTIRGTCLGKVNDVVILDQCSFVKK